MNLLKYLLAAVVILVALRMARAAIGDIARAARTEPSMAALPGRGMEPQLTAGGAAAYANANALDADLKAVKDLARQEPRVVANVVKDWVGRE